MIEAWLAAMFLIFILVLLVLRGRNIKSKDPQVATGGYLDRIAALYKIDREYYGNDEYIRPNDHCFWNDYVMVVGWYENDAHLRKRIIFEIEKT